MASIAKLKVEGGDEAVETINSVQKSLDKLNKVQAKNRDATRLLDKATGGAVTKFQDLQKGVTQGIVGIKGLATSFKGLKGAIAATGIGLIVVALGTIVAYWDDIVGFISGATAEQERLNRETQISKELLNDEVNLLFKQLNLQELKGESTDETLATLRKSLQIQKERLQIELAAAIVEAQKQKAQDEELSFFDKLKASFVIKKGYNYQENLARIQEEKRNTTSEEYIGLLENVNKLSGELITKNTQLENLDIKKEKRRKKELDDIKKTEQAEFDEFEKFLIEKEKLEDAYFQSKLKKEEQEKNKVRDKYFNLIEQAKKYGEDITVLEQAREAELKEVQDKFKLEREEQEAEDALIKQEKLIEKLELDKEFEQLNFDEQREVLNQRSQALLDDKTLTDEQRLALESQFADADTKIKEAKAQSDAEIEQAKMDLLGSFGGFLQQIAGDNKTLAIGGVVASQAAAVGNIVSQTAIANAKSIAAFPVSLGQPFVGLNTAAAGISIASTIASAAQSISKIKSSGNSNSTMKSSVPASAGGGAATPPPAFNIVGQSDTSQLSETIANQANEPVRAFVVSNDVTTAQSLERNIVQGATI